MALDYPALVQDVQDETDWLLGALDGLSAADSGKNTPAAGWDIKDQLAHLAYFDDAARLAIMDPDGFRAKSGEVLGLGTDFPDILVQQSRTQTWSSIQNQFTDARSALMALLQSADPKARIPWYGPDMSVASCATARLMETWAHGQDIYDTLALPHPIGTGIRSIAHLGVSTFAFAHSLHGIPVPVQPVRIELTSPDGQELWTWGPESAVDRVSGPVVDFVLVVTQRRHLASTALTIDGAVASGWMRIAQAYAGAAGQGRPE